MGRAEENTISDVQRIAPTEGSTVPLFRVTQCLQLPPRLYGPLLRREAHPLGPLKTCTIFCSVSTVCASSPGRARRLRTC